MPCDFNSRITIDTAKAYAMYGSIEHAVQSRSTLAAKLQAEAIAILVCRK